MYDNMETLLAEIAAGEDTYLEFKEVVFRGDKPRFSNEDGRAGKVIAEVFVSIANTEGGVVLFGVNKDGDIVGVDPQKKDILEQWIVNNAIELCLPKGCMEPRLDWQNLPDDSGEKRLILKVDIPKSLFYVHQTTDGRFLKRVGSHRVPIPAEQLGRLLVARSLLIPFEERPCPGAVITEFAKEKFDAYYQRRFGVSYTESGLTLEKLLENLKLGMSSEDGLWNMTNLGVLIFSERPQKWLPGAYLEIALYDHGEADGNTLDVKRFEGSIDVQIKNLIEYMDKSPSFSVVSEKTAIGRVDRPTYSSLAIQEAVVNAVVHRDYELTGSQAIVNIFPDRVEIRNPGSLHNTLKPEDLYAGCQPFRRNQHLAGFFRDFYSPLTGGSFMEARGIDFLSLVRESEALSGRRPRFEVIGQTVKLTIYAACEHVF